MTEAIYPFRDRTEAGRLLAEKFQEYANRRDVVALHVPDEIVDTVAEKEVRELERREREYRDDRAPVDVRGHTVILIDDGLATGSSMRAAALALRNKQPAQIVVAVPVGSPSTCAEFESEVDKVVCVVTPEPFWGVGQWYRDFSQTSDEEVRNLLGRAASFHTHRAA